MEGWFQLDWFGSDWNASNWDGPGGDTNGVTISAPLIEGVGTVGSTGITGTGTVTISAPDTEGYGYHRHRGGGWRKNTGNELQRLIAQDDEAILSAIMAFVEFEEEEWRVPLRTA